MNNETIHITIRRDSDAAKAFKEFMAAKKAFRIAAEEGRANEYVNDKKDRTTLSSQPR